MQDMLVRLFELPSYDSDRQRLAAEGLTCRRAETYERVRVLAFVRERWPDWLDEAAAAFSHVPPTMYIAHAGAEIFGFAAYHASRPNLLGPMGVDETARMHGIGKVLAWQSLSAMANEGYVYAIASGDGPAEFFAHTVGATPIDAVGSALSNDLRTEAA